MADENAAALDKAFYHLELKGGTPAGDLQMYAPGEIVAGTIQVEPRSDIRCRKLTVHLEWHTEGKGDRDGAVVGSRDLAEGNLRVRQSVGDQFMFQLPAQPWSYSGHYISIVWEIVVKMDVPLGRDISYRQPIIVDPGPPNLEQ